MVLRRHGAAGLALAYYGFHHRAPHLAGTPIRHAFRGRWVEPVASLADLIAVIAVTIGVAASAAPQLAVAALFVRAIWWWTIGKLWWETDVVARWLGAVTLGLAVGEFALVLALGPLGADMSVAWLPLRVLLGVWLIVLSIELWRTRHHA